MPGLDSDDPNSNPSQPAPSLLPPPGTLVLSLLTLAAAVAQSIWGWGRIAQALGVAKSHISLAALFNIGDAQAVPGCLTLITYVFPHAGWWHVLPNMTAFWLFGAIAERETGTWRFAGGYLLSGIIGVLCYQWVVPNAAQPLAGASLAIAGLAGGYASWRWTLGRHSRSRRLVAHGLETAAIGGAIAWLALRTIPPAPNLASSLMYHFLPFLTMWIGVQAWLGFRSLEQKNDRPNP